MSNKYFSPYIFFIFQLSRNTHKFKEKKNLKVESTFKMSKNDVSHSCKNELNTLTVI